MPLVRIEFAHTSPQPLQGKGTSSCSIGDSGNMPGDSILDLDTQLTCIAARISGGQKASSNARRRKDWRAFNVICTIVRKQSSGQARLEHPERNLSQIAKKSLVSTLGIQSNRLMANQANLARSIKEGPMTRVNRLQTTGCRL